jgi:hypothetical protein
VAVLKDVTPLLLEKMYMESRLHKHSPWITLSWMAWCWRVYGGPRPNDDAAEEEASPRKKFRSGESTEKSTELLEELHKV